MRKTKFVAGEYYHIYNRGNSRQEIFHEDSDYNRFQKLLYLCNSEKHFNFRDDVVRENLDAFFLEKDKDLVKICAYALMPNHFHLFVFIPNDASVSGSDDLTHEMLPLFLKKLTGSYSKYFNSKYNRTGSLFEGRFKAEHVTDDNYYKYLFSYINLNPVKLIQNNWKDIGVQNISGVLNFLNEYKYSSFVDYFVDERRAESRIINKESFYQSIHEQIDLKEDVLEWLKISEESRG